MNNKNSLSKFVLLALEKTVDGCIRMEDFVNNPGYYAYSDGWGYPLKKNAIAKALKRLRENGLINFIDDKTLIFRLTDEGRDKALWIKMKEIEEKWDGKWRIISWDIPEKRKPVRDLLRNKLKQLGFIKLQKSVWASKKNCTKELKNFIKSVGIKDWVLVLETEDIGF